MPYSIISILALILNLILNRGTFKLKELRSGSKKDEHQVVIQYGRFLVAANCYFVLDATWGILYAYRTNNAVYPYLYLATILYFVLMFLLSF